MRPCYFCKELPQIEIRGDHIFILPSHGDYEIALTPRMLQKMVASYNRILDEWHEHRAKVVPIKAP